MIKLKDLLRENTHEIPVQPIKKAIPEFPPIKTDDEERQEQEKKKNRGWSKILDIGPLSLEVVAKDIPPPKMNLEPEAAFNIALKFPFTSFAYALENGPHPRIAAVLKGTPYERQYNQKFGDK